MEDLVNILASAVGSLTNPTKLANTFHSVMQSDISDKTIKSYIDCLQEAFLIDTAIRYDIKGKKYINTPMKIYFVLEVDFIAYKGNNKYYIQSVFALPDEEKKKQEERPLLCIDDSFKKIVVVGNHIKLKRDDKGIMTIGIHEFLMKQNSLEL